MIDKNAFGLAGFSLVESSENGMLAQVKRAEHLKQWVVFLGWGATPDEQPAADALPGRR